MTSHTIIITVLGKQSGYKKNRYKENLFHGHIEIILLHLELMHKLSKNYAVFHRRQRKSHLLQWAVYS